MDAVQQLDAMKSAYQALESLDEEGRQRALAWLADALGVTSLARPKPPRDKEANAGRDLTDGGVGELDAKGFLAAKNPRSDVERVTCLAYFITHGRGVRHFKTRELTSLNVDAAGARFSNISQAAKDAVKVDYLASVGREGKRQITAFGEAVVEALPDRVKVKEILEQRGRRRRKKTARKRTSTRE